MLKISIPGACVLGCVAMHTIAARAPADTILEFGSQFAHVTITNNSLQSDFNNNNGGNGNAMNGPQFGVNFTGQLGLSSNPNTMYVGSFLDRSFLGNEDNFNVESLDGEINFVGGNIENGTLNFTISNGELRNTYSADFTSTTNSVSWDSSRDQFAITGGLRNIQLGRGTPVAPDNGNGVNDGNGNGVNGNGVNGVNGNGVNGNGVNGNGEPPPPGPGFQTPGIPAGPGVPPVDIGAPSPGVTPGQFGEPAPPGPGASLNAGMSAVNGTNGSDGNDAGEQVELIDLDFTNTFAGQDIAEFHEFEGELVGSFFAFMYDGSIRDEGTAVVTATVVPLPPAVWIGLAGLAMAGGMARRMRR